MVGRRIDPFDGFHSEDREAEKDVCERVCVSVCTGQWCINNRTQWFCY